MSLPNNVLSAFVRCPSSLHSCLYTTVPTPPRHSEVHLKFRTDLHIDLPGQSAEQNSDSIALCTHAWLRGSSDEGCTPCKLTVE